MIWLVALLWRARAGDQHEAPLTRLLFHCQRSRRSPTEAGRRRRADWVGRAGGIGPTIGETVAIEVPAEGSSSLRARIRGHGLRSWVRARASQVSIGMAPWHRRSGRSGGTLRSVGAYGARE
jgi:hypothetical protein